MINENTIDSYNMRLTSNLSSLKDLTPAQLDKIKNLGSNAENLLKHKDFAMFIHQFKFEKIDSLTDIQTYEPADQLRRIAIGNQLNGIEDFINMLKHCVYLKDKIIKMQTTEIKENRQNTEF